ncbi:ABC transporter ATP-binding protein [Mariniblastus fucicola]|uniref:ABC transporter ATP-binding protein n=1 Tax=Mariniblastus fucicola TaxID=980251 RepID=UPI001EE4D784|nr:ABC transporter ATP-binding protein [Mariniblastus fucicola]
MNRVSFKVFPGEVFGFIGPNGAGKTTSMKILSTLDTPDSGSAKVDGFCSVNDPERVRRRLGYMPDGFGAYANVTCEEYLDFFARSYGLRGKDRIHSLRNVMGFTQLDQIAQKPITGLSKGMKQRLCLGRALIHNPKVLVLDEPAAGLDPRARIELREMITALADDGKSLLISSHILTELAEMCDRVAIIEQGGLLAVGSVEDILSGDHQRSSEDTTGGQVVTESGQLVVQILGDAGAARSWIENELSLTVRITGNSLQFPFSGSAEDQAALLRKMVDSGIAVVSFSNKQRSLEDAFLHVTRGRVQ